MIHAFGHSVERMQKKYSKEERKKPKPKAKKDEFGKGYKFNFHGRFLKKEEAEEKEKQVPGSFIRETEKDGVKYYMVLKEK